jgi:NADH:ubiquinone oxidoreductase subunit 6 (subunit J)
MGTLNIIEINITYNIMYFIIIVITIGYIIYMNNIIYISLIMILVYSTALIILFGFVIMKKKKQYSYTSLYYINPLYYYIFPIILIIYNIMNKEDIIYNIYEYNISETDIITLIGNILYTDPIYIIQIILSAIILLYPIIAIIYL